MPARATIAHLIDRLRLWIADPSGAGEALSDEALESFLDDNRFDEAAMQLTPARTITPGSHAWTDYRAERGWWEDGVLLQGVAGATLTPDTEDLLRGRWTFALDTPPPVLITGSRFDLHGAAADAITSLIAGLRDSADWSDGQVSVRRAGQLTSLRELADDHRRRSQGAGGSRQIRLRRSDQVPAR